MGLSTEGKELLDLLMRLNLNDTLKLETKADEIMKKVKDLPAIILDVYTTHIIIPELKTAYNQRDFKRKFPEKLEQLKNYLIWI